MSTVKQTEAAVQNEGESISLLEQAISATKQTDREQAKELLKTLTEKALSGAVTWKKNLLVTINAAMAEIDKKISKQN